MKNNFFCEICGLHYKYERYFVLNKKKHENNNFKERVYSCNVCVESFSGSKALKKHNIFDFFIFWGPKGVPKFENAPNPFWSIFKFWDPLRTPKKKKFKNRA